MKGSSTINPQPARTQWGNKIEFILTCVGYAVGLGNVWRFPYKCYQNGGGAFLLPYFLLLGVLGIPLFFLEVSLGQFSGRGPMSVWEINPSFRGVGYSCMIIVPIIQCYYVVVVGYTLFYLFSSFRSEVPWKYCQDDSSLFPYRSWVSPCCMESFSLFVKEAPGGPKNELNVTKFLESPNSNISFTNSSECPQTTLPSEDFFKNFVLELSESTNVIGGFKWDLALCLILAWSILFVVLSKGIKTLGKVVYFSAIFPYIILTILLIRGLTLPGSWDGIVLYLKPDFSKLLSPAVWQDAAVQIFYSLGVSLLSLLTLASFNPYHNNVLRDALIVPVINCLTSLYAGFVIFSVLGYMAHVKNVDVKDVAQVGPGLAFIVYPEAIAKMEISPLWSILFFIMMANLGFSSMVNLNIPFGGTEAAIITFMDRFPGLRKTPLRDILFRLVFCFVCLLIGFTMCTNGGFYIMNMMDQRFAGIPMLILGLLEVVQIGWIYGFKQFSDDISIMLGFDNWGKPYFRLCWQIFAPAVLLVILLASIIQYQPLSVNIGSTVMFYPTWSEVISWCFVAFAVIFCPICFFIELYTARVRGTRQINEGQNLFSIVTQPLPSWGPLDPVNREIWTSRRTKPLDNELVICGKELEETNQNYDSSSPLKPI